MRDLRALLECPRVYQPTRPLRIRTAGALRGRYRADGQRSQERTGRGVDFRDAYARVEGHNVELEGLYIPPYTQASYNNHEPRRKRRLLLKREEIRKLERTLSQTGLTLVPVRLYEKGRHFKIELAVARGKKLHDKRRSESERDARREMRDA